MNAQEIRSLLTQRIGVRWSEDRVRDLDQFLARRAVDPQDENALAEFMNGETSFFRYPLYLRVLQALLERHPAERPLRVLSAACSSGEEAYSAAFALVDRARETERQVEIVGSDVRARAIAAARRAIYGQWSFRNLPPADRLRYFESDDGQSWRVREPYRSAPRFLVRNLLDAADDVAYDAVLLCNATLYMEPHAARRAYETMASLLRPEGLLMLAPTDPPPGAAWSQAEEYGGWTIFRRATRLPEAPGLEDASGRVAARSGPRPARPPAGLAHRPPAPVAPRPSDSVGQRSHAAATLCAVGSSADTLWNAWANGSLASAQDELRQRIFLEPESPLWRFLNGVVLWDQGWLRRASREIERAARLAADTADDVSVAGLCSAAELRGMIEFWRKRHA